MSNVNVKEKVINSEEITDDYGKRWYYDIECLINFFSIYLINRDTGEHRCYYIHESCNQIYEIYNFLYYECKQMIGFNNINYDYPMLHYFMLDLRYHESHFNDADYVCKLLHDYSIYLINRKSTFAPIKPWEVMIPQVDIFRIHHFDNAAKRTSLKATEFVMRVENLENMPIEHDEYVDVDDIPKILYYNKNDVIETKRLVEFSSDMLLLREQISEQFGIDATNFNDTKIGAELFLKFMCEKMGLDPKEVKKRRTERESVDLNKIIFPYISFKTPQFQELLKRFKGTIVHSTKNPFKYNVNFRGVSYDYGVGGVHGAVKASIHRADDYFMILDIDVASYYPRMAIVNKLYPAHLGPEFCDIYEDRYNYRMSLKVKKDKTAFEKLAVSLWKLALNGVYGKSGDENSFFYDLLYMLSITVNGQLLLTMLTERILLEIGESEMLQINTDGVTVRFPRQHYDKLMELCSRFEQLTALTLEYTPYNMIAIQDVNNYIASKVGEEDKLWPSLPKCDWYDNFYTKHKVKGRLFQVVKEQNGAVAFNKDWSYIIVSKALYNYFIYNKPVKDTITECKDIYDFLARAKTTKDWYAEFIDAKGQASMHNGVVRYYISSTGGKLVKRFTSGKSSGQKKQIEAKGRVVLANRIDPSKKFEEYNVDYTYYMRRCNEVILNIENKGQLKLL